VCSRETAKKSRRVISGSTAGHVREVLIEFAEESYRHLYVNGFVCRDWVSRREARKESKRGSWTWALCQEWNTQALCRDVQFQSWTQHFTSQNSAKTASWRSRWHLPSASRQTNPVRHTN